MTNYESMMTSTDFRVILKAAKVEASDKDYSDSYSIGWLAGALSTQNRKIAKLESQLKGSK